MATIDTAAEAAISRTAAGRAWGWVGRQAVNPVLVRDARSMFRGRRMILLQLLYLTALIVVMGISAFVLYEQRRYGVGSRASLPEFGQYIFIAMFETQVVLLLLVAVAYSAGAISLEREKQTYEILAITSLTSAQVVLGKIASITCLCYLLMFTSAPLAAFSLFFGGVSPGEMVACYGLLALKIPLWAGLGVLASIIASGSIAAHVLALIAVGGENAASGMLMAPWSGNVSPGLFSAFVAPFMNEIQFRLFNWQIPGWLLPLPYAVLLTALLMVGAAEAMQHYRPKRSPLLRVLLLAVSFYMVFLLTAVAWPATASAGSGVPLLGTLVLVWMWAVAFVPVFVSYPGSPDGEKHGLGWSTVGPAGWLARDARGGGGFCLLLWGASLAGAFLAAGLAVVSTHGTMAAAKLPGAPELVIALAIYGLAIIAYSAFGAALALVVRARREAALATVLLMLFLNSVAPIYAMGEHIMRRVPSAPALVLMSPAAAASTILSYGRPSDWSRYTPEQALAYGLGYSILLICGAYWYYRIAMRRRVMPA